MIQPTVIFFHMIQLSFVSIGFAMLAHGIYNEWEFFEQLNKDMEEEL